MGAKNRYSLGMEYIGACLVRRLGITACLAIGIGLVEVGVVRVEVRVRLETGM